MVYDSVWESVFSLSLTKSPIYQCCKAFTQTGKPEPNSLNNSSNCLHSTQVKTVGLHWDFYSAKLLDRHLASGWSCKRCMDMYIPFPDQRITISWFFNWILYETSLKRVYIWTSMSAMNVLPIRVWRLITNISITLLESSVMKMRHACATTLKRLIKLEIRTYD